ncbi:MAG TPA: addiction module toxin, HicA family [Cyanothece sp. UBA12306]|nr:addiction module toxin, HicA family [Cyanothece sp. UBA12306]
MKRSDLIRHLQQYGCELLREGSRHSIWWNPSTKNKSSIPRHREIKEFLAKKICKDLDLPLL